MRFLQVLKTNPAKMVFPALAALLLAALAIFGASSSPVGNSASETNKPGVGVRGEQTESEASTESENSDEDSRQNSSTTKRRVSLQSSTINGETTGQVEVEVTENGETTIFEETISGSKVSIKIDDQGDFKINEDDGKTEVKFKSSNRTSTKSEFEFNQQVDIEQD